VAAQTAATERVFHAQEHSRFIGCRPGCSLAKHDIMTLSDKTVMHDTEAAVPPTDARVKRSRTSSLKVECAINACMALKGSHAKNRRLLGHRPSCQTRRPLRIEVRPSRADTLRSRITRRRAARRQAPGGLGALRSARQRVRLVDHLGRSCLTREVLAAGDLPSRDTRAATLPACTGRIHPRKASARRPRRIGRGKWQTSAVPGMTRGTGSMGCS